VYLKKLGFADTDRVVILHADDIGMCHSTITAYTDLASFGVLSSAAVMVTCPWFPAAAEAIPQIDGPTDVGVHLTLTSEWGNYRWRAVSTADPATGLFDEQGYFPRNTDPARAHATGASVARELKAQIDRALAFGIDITHIDTHMGTVLNPHYLPIYMNLALEYRVPALALRPDESQLRANGFDGTVASEMTRLSREFEERGLPLFDHVYCMSLGDHEGRLQEAVQALANCPPGLTHFIIHPSSDTPELRAIAPDWRSRVADRALFLDEAWRAAIAESGVRVVGYRALREALRAT
jgi:predicted glycoside hydrolase/deacetylase ChbG (UPF0249 family)